MNLDHGLLSSWRTSLRRARLDRLVSRGRTLCLLAVAFLGPALARAQMTIDEIIITSGPGHDSNVFSEYFVGPVVFGTGIDRVFVTSQSGTLDTELFEVTPGEFVCTQEIPSEPCENLVSLAEISALGDLTFDFLGDFGETDSVTIPLADYDPGSGRSGFANVSTPLPGETGLPTSLTVEWSAPPGWVQGIDVGVEDLVTGLTADDVFLVGSPLGAPVTDTTWSPANLTSGRYYELEISFVEIYLIEDPRTSSGGRDYSYSSGFESFNQLVFAVPEPTGASGLAAGLLLLGGLARRGRFLR